MFAGACDTCTNHRLFTDEHFQHDFFDAGVWRLCNKRPGFMNPARNAACPCGSGKRYKECCGRIAHTSFAVTQPQPDHAVPAAAMAQLAALMNAGRVIELEVKARKLTDTYPDAGVIWQVLAVSLSAQGKDALAALQTAAILMPDDAVAQMNLGNALGRLHRIDEAIACYRRALQINPEFAAAHGNLGNALLETKNLQEAIASFHKAVQLKPDFSQAHNSLGNALRESGQFEHAIQCYQRAITLQPDFAEAHGNLGSALSAIGKLNDAIASYQRALRLAPTLAEVHLNLGNALRELAKLDEAIACYEAALQIKPDLLQCHASIATALRLQGSTDAAEIRCQHALTLYPNDNSTLIVLAEIRADQGRFAEAEQLLTQVIGNEPHATEAWSSLVRIRKLTLADAPLMQVAQTVATSVMLPRKELYVRYALGKYFDDVKEYDQAFNQYQCANQLTKLIRPAHSQSQVTRDVDLMIDYFDRTFFAQQTHAGNQSLRPVLIVGMLRSGTSLAEQILASHPEIVGAGELPFWGRAAADFDFSQRNTTATISATSKVADDYLRLLQSLSSDALRIIDKMPSNFLFMGLVHAAFPQARFIHMQRNPVDTCLSIYFQHFETSLSYANDLHDLAQYYREYLRLMRHWHATLPRNVILDMSYEMLADDTASCTRKMLEFIDLRWDERCLDYTQTYRSVITASKWQVRQKINKASVERWRNYEKFAGPLLGLMNE